MLYFGGLGVEELARKLVSIGSDKSSIFQGHRTCMTRYIKNKVAPFITRMHCFAHRTNMVVITLLNVPLLHQLEGILQNIYVFYPHNLKKFVEFQKLANLLNTKDNKILWNVKTHWISMLSPSKKSIINIGLSL